nr:MAG TPA: hypothetical protein [Caudoviricetes sp.]
MILLIFIFEHKNSRQDFSHLLLKLFLYFVLFYFCIS